MDELIFWLAAAVAVGALAYRMSESEPVRAQVRRAAARHATRALRRREHPPSLVRQFREAGLIASGEDPVPAFYLWAQGPVAETPGCASGAARVVLRCAGRRSTGAGVVERSGGPAAPTSAHSDPAGPPAPAGPPDRAEVASPTPLHSSLGRATEAAVLDSPSTAAVSVRGMS